MPMHSLCQPREDRVANGGRLQLLLHSIPSPLACSFQTYTCLVARDTATLSKMKGLFQNFSSVRAGRYKKRETPDIYQILPIASTNKLFVSTTTDVLK